MYKYKIENSGYETKYVVADDMKAALCKYYNYLVDHLSYDTSPDAVFKCVTSCVYECEYDEDNDLIR